MPFSSEDVIKNDENGKIVKKTCETREVFVDENGKEVDFVERDQEMTAVEQRRQLQKQKKAKKQARKNGRRG